MTYKYRPSADRTVPIVSTIEDDMKSAAANDGLSDPRHTVRATRTAGRQMRSRLLDSASRLFKEQGLAAVSIADIAAAANAFPSQITYYFRTKEALFVEAACRDVLYVGARGRAARGQATLAGRLYPRAGRQRDGIGCRRLLRRGHDADPPPPGSRAAGGADRRAAACRRLARLCAEMAARGWHSRLDPETSARRFWAIAIGVTLEGHAMGRAPDDLAAEMLRLIGQQADAPPASARLKVVGAGNSSLESR